MKRQLKRLQSPRRGIQYIVDASTREELSPFVFFDAGTMQRSDDGLFIDMHPHSGIGIITYFEGANLIHDDTGQNDNVIRNGGIQWIQAGAGVWHEEKYQRLNNSIPWPLTIHQLWLQLPPHLEESEVEYQNIQPEDLPNDGQVKVIAGTYENASSPLKLPYNLSYLDVSLDAGESFTCATPRGQTTGFIFPRKGEIRLYDVDLPLQHLSILENNEGIIKVEANLDSQFILLLSAPQDYPIYSKSGSIHTNEMSFRRSRDKINELASKLT